MYMLDSCICVDLMRGNLPSAFELMRNSSPRYFKIPAVAAAELYFGVENSSSPKDYLLATERFLQPYEIVPFDGACAKAYAAIRNQLKLAGKTIGANDMLIAATALAHQARLATKDKSFTCVPGLQVEMWGEAKL